MSRTRSFSRRQFALLLALAVVCLVLAGSVVWAWSSAGLTRLVSTAVRKRLPTLEHDDDVLAAFAADYLADIGAHRRSQLSPLALFWPAYAGTDLLRATPLEGRIALLEDSAARAYLMSTDFFYRDTADHAPPRYLGLYSPPYAGACRNPFATLTPA